MAEKVQSSERGFWRQLGLNPGSSSSQLCDLWSQAELATGAHSPSLVSPFEKRSSLLPISPLVQVRLQVWSLRPDHRTCASAPCLPLRSLLSV